MSATKIGKNTTKISKLLFVTVNLHFVTSNQISTFRKLNLPLSSRIYFVFLPLEMQKKTQADQSMPSDFLLCLKRKTHKALKVAAVNSLFSNMYVIGTAYFVECFSFSVVTKRHCFSRKFVVTLRLFLSTILELSLNPVFWIKSVFYALSPH